MVLQIERLKYRISITLVVLVLVVVIPVYADLFNGYYRVAPHIEQGATVFIGEQGLDITQAVASANAASVQTSYTTIGWWASAADIGNTAPTVSVDTTGRASTFTVTQSEFDGYEGQWYLADPSAGYTAKQGVGAVFNVRAPLLDGTIRDLNGIDMSGKSVPTGSRLQFQIGTNMYTTISYPSYRNPVWSQTGSGANSDGYLDIKVKYENGTTFTRLYDDNNLERTLIALNVSTQPFTWGRANAGIGPGIDYVWNTSTYPSGTYVVSVESKLNNMQANYLSGGGLYTGRTVSAAKTITLVGGIPLTNATTKIGIFNGGNWYMDYSGDGQFISATGDKYIPYGATGWTQLVGDWNGDGKSEIGIYKDGLWYIDYGGSGVIDTNTRYYSFGGAGWIPLVGDWNADKKDEIGIYQNGNWYLDNNGNGVWDAGDLNYGFGTTGWTPVTGKWTSDGSTKIGIYNGGNWYIDFNGDGQFIPATGDRYIPYGASGWTQLVGDWNGDGTSEIGIFKDGLWYIDYGGSGVIDANTRYYSFGGSGWTPLIGDWNADTKDEIGVYQNGNWYLDNMGNGVWDAGDLNYGFGSTGWTPVVGKW